MNIYKMDKLYTFHISRKERLAINEIRRHGINVSRFLRRELRRFADQLIVDEHNEKSIKENCKFECCHRL